MQRSLTRLASRLILVGGLAWVVSGCDTGVRASQATMSSDVTGKVTGPTSGAIAPGTIAPGTIESDSIVTDCDQLAKVSMAAELNAMGLERSLPANPTSLAKNVQDLQQSVVQLQGLPLQNNQVMQLRDQYVTLLQSLSQTEPSSAVAATVQAAVKLRRDKIFFNSCKS